MTREEIQRFFERRQDAIRRRDFEALTLLYAEDCIIESPLAGQVRGRAAIENILRGMLDGFPDLVLENPQLLIDGDYAVQVVTLAGTNVGGFMNLPATGKRFELPLVSIFRFENGMVAHEKRVYDFTGMLLQTGVLKAKPI